MKFTWSASRERPLYVFVGFLLMLEPNFVCFRVAKEIYGKDCFPATMWMSSFTNQVFLSSSKEVSALWLYSGVSSFIQTKVPWSVVNEILFEVPLDSWQLFLLYFGIMKLNYPNKVTMFWSFNSSEPFQLLTSGELKF